MIKKTSKGYRVVSHTTGRSFGTYKTKSEAVKRLMEVKFYGKSK